VEFDDVKALWKETDRRLEAMETTLRLQQRLVEVSIREGTRSRLRFIRPLLWYEAGFSALAALLVGSYLGDSFGNLQFWIPAALLQLVVIGTFAAAAYQLLTLAQIDYTGPVLAIQRDLAQVRVVRARWNRWLLLWAPLLWVLLIIVVPHALFEADVYQLVGLGWLSANFGFGVAVLGLAVLVSRRLMRPAPGSAFLRRIGDDVNGWRVAEAAGFLDEIAKFRDS
jgi:hypothetical protein